MTDREKKQRDIIGKVWLDGMEKGQGLSGYSQETITDQALAELSKLDAIPTSKEVEEAVRIAINSSRIFCEFALKCTLLGEFNSKEDQIKYIQKMEDELVQTLIQAVKPKEEVGVEKCPYCKADLKEKPLGNPDLGYGGERKC